MFHFPDSLDDKEKRRLAFLEGTTVEKTKTTYDESTELKPRPNEQKPAQEIDNYSTTQKTEKPKKRAEETQIVLPEINQFDARNIPERVSKRKKEKSRQEIHETTHEINHFDERHVPERVSKRKKKPEISKSTIENQVDINDFDDRNLRKQVRTELDQQRVHAVETKPIAEPTESDFGSVNIGSKSRKSKQQLFHQEVVEKLKNDQENLTFLNDFSRIF